MSKAYEKIVGNWMTVQDVEDYLGVGYQTWRKYLDPSNYDYSAGDRGTPKNLYKKDDVLAFDSIMKYHENKDRYTVKDVSDILGRSSVWILQEITPTSIVKRGERTFTYYDKELIDQYLKIKSGVKIESNQRDIDQLNQVISELQTRIKELEESNKIIKVSDAIKALMNCDLEVEL